MRGMIGDLSVMEISQKSGAVACHILETKNRVVSEVQFCSGIVLGQERNSQKDQPSAR